MLDQRLYKTKSLTPVILIKRRNVKGVTKNVIITMKEVGTDFWGDKEGLYKEKNP